MAPPPDGLRLRLRLMAPAPAAGHRTDPVLLQGAGQAEARMGLALARPRAHPTNLRHTFLVVSAIKSSI